MKNDLKNKLWTLKEVQNYGLICAVLVILLGIFGTIGVQKLIEYLF